MVVQPLIALPFLRTFYHVDIMQGRLLTHIYVLSSRDVDDVHDMMDDISEQNEIAEEISSALSTPIGFNQEIDDVRC